MNGTSKYPPCLENFILLEKLKESQNSGFAKNPIDYMEAVPLTFEMEIDDDEEDEEQSYQNSQTAKNTALNASTKQQQIVASEGTVGFPKPTEQESGSGTKPKQEFQKKAYNSPKQLTMDKYFNLGKSKNTTKNKQQLVDKLNGSNGSSGSFDEEDNHTEFVKYFFKKMKSKALSKDSYKAKVNSLKGILKKNQKHSVATKASSDSHGSSGSGKSDKSSSSSGWSDATSKKFLPPLKNNGTMIPIYQTSSSFSQV